MERALEMVRQYVRAGYAKIHLDASMRCADDPAGALADSVAAERTAELAAAAETAAADRPAATPLPVYVIGTEVPTPGGQASDHEGPIPTRVEDARRGLELTRAAFARRGLDAAWQRVLAQVVQPGVEFGDDAVHRYRREAAVELRAFSESQERLVFEAHSTDYQTEAALRALVEDHFAVLKVGPELTFALREALFALESIERELLGRRAPERLSGMRQALERAMGDDPRHWQSYYGQADEDTLRLRRAFSLSDRARYYWPVPEVQEAVSRLIANLDAERLPNGVLSQYLPGLDAGRAGRAGAGNERPPRAAPRAARAVALRSCLRARRGSGSPARELALMMPGDAKPQELRVPRLLVEERRRRILELLDEQERVTVEELVTRFSVSAVTIRGDLDALAGLGAVVRSHGGALKRGDAPEDVPITVKETLHHAEKVRIGHAAAQMIQDGETIMLDSGTTTAEIARQIRFLRLRSLNVITNALNIAMELANLPHVRLIMIGGVLRQMSYSLAGPPAEATLRSLHADRLFLGVDGLDPEIGLMTPDVVEAQLNAVMIQVSREVVVVADASKFQRRSLSVIAKLDVVHKVITDSGADPEALAALRARNLEVIVV